MVETLAKSIACAGLTVTVAAASWAALQAITHAANVWAAHIQAAMP